jgi:hypothetical protein
MIRQSGANPVPIPGLYHRNKPAKCLNYKARNVAERTMAAISFIAAGPPRRDFLTMNLVHTAVAAG